MFSNLVNLEDRGGHVDGVIDTTEYVEYTYEKFNEYVGYSLTSGLMKKVSLGDIDTVKELVEVAKSYYHVLIIGDHPKDHAPFNYFDHFCANGLRQAANVGSLECTKLLLDAANWNVRPGKKFGHQLLGMAFYTACNGGYHEIVAMLLDKHCKNDKRAISARDIELAYHYALRRNHFKCIKLLADLSFEIPETDDVPYDALSDFETDEAIFILKNFGHIMVPKYIQQLKHIQEMNSRRYMPRELGNICLRYAY
jgi:hypothetical protein